MTGQIYVLDKVIANTLFEILDPHSSFLDMSTCNAFQLQWNPVNITTGPQKGDCINGVVGLMSSCN